MRLSGTDWVEGGWDVAETCAFARMPESRVAPPCMSPAAGWIRARRFRPAHHTRSRSPARSSRASLFPSLPWVWSASSNRPRRSSAPATQTWSRSRGPSSTCRRWPWHAAAHLGARVKAPNQYLRSQPRQYRALFDVEGSAEGYPLGNGAAPVRNLLDWLQELVPEL